MGTEQDSLARWLLDGDPAVRWQVMRDLLRESPSIYEAERENVAREGWGHRLLTLQSADGLWGTSLYNGRWTSTTYSLYVLKVLGLAPHHPQALAGCERLIRGGLHKAREIRFSRGQTVADLGVTALVLSITSYFGWPPGELSTIAGYLSDQQRADGSWRPNDSQSASDYEFETTLLVLEALLQFERAHKESTGWIPGVRQRGWRFLLDRHLGIESGGPLKRGWGAFAFPSYWFYDCLTALDCLRDSQHRDPGAQDAIDLVRARRKPDGRWGRGGKHAGRTYFDMDTPGEPSRWNTLRATRVLEWWDASAAISV